MNQSAELSIVLGFRDRDVERVVRCLESLRRQTYKGFVAYVVDYGSVPDCALRLKQAAGQYDFCTVIRTETRGYPWNRSRALNIGGRRVSSSFIMTTDADMVFPADFLEKVIASADNDKILYCFPHFLPRGFSDWDNLQRYIGELPVGTADSRGGFLTVAAKVYQDIRGFDEYYQFWGVEDHDLHQRLMRLGLSELWMNENTAIFHQWHTPANAKTQNLMPLAHWARMQSHYQRYAQYIARNDENWGRILQVEDRPVFRHVNFDAMALVRSSNLTRFKSGGNREWDAGRFVHEFWQLSSGRAMSVSDTSFPAQYPWLRGAFGVVNRSLHAARLGTRIDYAQNPLRTYLVEFIAENPDIVADYYLDLPIDKGTSILVRA